MDTNTLQGAPRLLPGGNASLKGGDDEDDDDDGEDDDDGCRKTLLHY